MKLKDIIHTLQQHLEEAGDTEVMSFKLVDETGGREWFMYSKTRVNPVTRIPMKMNIKEFLKHLKSER